MLNQSPASDFSPAAQALIHSDQRDEILACLDFIGFTSTQDPDLLDSLTLTALPVWLDEQGFQADSLVQYFLNVEELVAPEDPPASLAVIYGSMGPDATVSMLLEAVAKRSSLVHGAIVQAIAEAHESRQQVMAVAGGMSTKNKIEAGLGVLAGAGVAALVVRAMRAPQQPGQGRRLQELFQDQPVQDVNDERQVGREMFRAVHGNEAAIELGLHKDTVRVQEQIHQEEDRAAQHFEDIVVQDVEEGDLSLEGRDARIAIDKVETNPKAVSSRLFDTEESVIERVTSEIDNSVAGYAKELFGHFEESFDKSLDHSLESLGEDVMTEDKRIARDIAKEEIDEFLGFPDAKWLVDP